MKNTIKKIIAMLLLMTIWSVAITPMPFWGKYAGSKVVTEAISLDVTIMEDMPYTIVYHTYNPLTGDDMVYAVDNVKSVDDFVTIKDCPTGEGSVVDSGGVFYGWTLEGMGTHEDNAEDYGDEIITNIVYYKKGYSKSFKELHDLQYPNDKVNQSIKVIHLYDIYNTSPTLTVKQDPDDPQLSSNDEVYNEDTIYTIRTYQEETSDYAAHHMIIKPVNSGTVNPNKFEFRSYSSQKVFLYHPGIKMLVYPETKIPSKDDLGLSETAGYVKDKSFQMVNYTDDNADCFSGKLENITRYVGVDYTENVYRAVFHTFNANGEDTIHKIISVRNISDPIEVVDYPTQHSDKTPSCWSDCGVEAISGYSSMSGTQKKFSPGDIFTIEDVISSETSLNTRVYHLFDVYEDYVLSVEPLEGTNLNGISYMMIFSSRIIYPDGSGNMLVVNASRNILKLNMHPGTVIQGVGNWSSDYYRVYFIDDGEKKTNANKNETHDNYDYTMKAENHTIYVATDYKDSSSGGGDSSGDGGNCFTTGTLVTLADGTQIPIEDLREDDILRVYDHENGKYVGVPILLLDYKGDKNYTIAHLEFADGTTLKLINERGLFDITLNKYVFITPQNCKNYIGHYFAKEKEIGFDAVELVDAYSDIEYTGMWSLTSTYHINHFIEHYLTVPGSIYELVNYFEYGENLQYEPEAMARDIEMYGLYTAEEFADYIPEFAFDKIYPIKYLKVAEGKGLSGFDDYVRLIRKWIIKYDLTDKVSEEETEEIVEELPEIEFNTDSVENAEIEWTFDEDGNAIVVITPNEDYTFDNFFEITIGEDTYTIDTRKAEQDNGIILDIDTGTLTIPKDFIEGDDVIIYFKIVAVLNKDEEEIASPEENKDSSDDDEPKQEDTQETDTDEPTDEIKLTFGIDVSEVENAEIKCNNDNDGNAVLVITAAKNGTLPETFIISIGDTEYTIDTTTEEQDDGIVWDSETGTLTIPKDLVNGENVKIGIKLQAIIKEDEDEEDDKKSEEDKKPGGDDSTEDTTSGATEGGENNTENDDAEGRDDVTDNSGENTETDTPVIPPITDGEQTGGNADTENGGGENIEQKPGDDITETPDEGDGTDKPVIPPVTDSGQDEDENAGGENIEQKPGDDITETPDEGAGTDKPVIPPVTDSGQDEDENAGGENIEQKPGDDITETPDEGAGNDKPVADGEQDGENNKPSVILPENNGNEETSGKDKVDGDNAPPAAAETPTVTIVPSVTEGGNEN